VAENLTATEKGNSARVVALSKEQVRGAHIKPIAREWQFLASATKYILKE